MRADFTATGHPMTQPPEEIRDYAESIVDTVRKPLVLLGQDLRVKMANRAFYTTFRVTTRYSIRASSRVCGNGRAATS